MCFTSRDEYTTFYSLRALAFVKDLSGSAFSCYKKTCLQLLILPPTPPGHATRISMVRVRVNLCGVSTWLWLRKTLKSKLTLPLDCANSCFSPFRYFCGGFCAIALLFWLLAVRAKTRKVQKNGWVPTSVYKQERIVIEILTCHHTRTFCHQAAEQQQNHHKEDLPKIQVMCYNIRSHVTTSGYLLQHQVMCCNIR